MNYDRNTTIDTRIADYISKRDSIDARIERLKQLKEIWDNLPFKEGDVAFHKEYGNVLIKSVIYGTTEEELEDIKYSIITCKDGYKKASYNELIPISEATKVLYAK